MLSVLDSANNLEQDQVYIEQLHANIVVSHYTYCAIWYKLNEIYYYIFSMCIIFQLYLLVIVEFCLIMPHNGFSINLHLIK